MFRAKLLFADSTRETEIEFIPRPGDVITVDTDNGPVSCQAKRVTWLNNPDGLTVEIEFLNPPKFWFRVTFAKLDLLGAYVELRQLGRTRLQSLCNGWLATPAALEAKVTTVTIANDFTVAFEAAIGRNLGQEYHFPADELLRFLVEHGIESIPMKESLLTRIAANRKAVGLEVYQRFSLGPVLGSEAQKPTRPY